MTRTPARKVDKRTARGSTNPAADRGAGPAAKRRPPPEGQPHAGPVAGGARPQPSGSAFVRKTSPPTTERPVGALSSRFPPSDRAPGSPQVLGGAPVSLGAQFATARAKPPSGAPAAPNTASAPPPAAPTTTLPRVRPPRLALRSGSSPVEVSSFTCGVLEEVEPQALGVTYWFDAAPDGAPYSVTVHISGRLRGQPAPGQRETFTVLGAVHDVVPGSGRIALTTRVPDLPHGTWDVTAIPVQPAPEGAAAEWMPVTDPRLPSGTACGTTALGPSSVSSRPACASGPGRRWSAPAPPWPWSSRACWRSVSGCPSSGCFPCPW